MNKPTHIPKLVKEYAFCQRSTDRQQKRPRKGAADNIGFAKWRVKCLYDSLLQVSSLVFQTNICANNPPLRKAENRYTSSFIETSYFSIISNCKTHSKSSIKKFEISPVGVTKRDKLLS